MASEVDAHDVIIAAIVDHCVDGSTHDTEQATIHRCPLRVETRITDHIGGALAGILLRAQIGQLGSGMSGRPRRHRRASPGNAAYRPRRRSSLAGTHPAPRRTRAVS